MGLLELDRPPRLELPAQVEQQLRYFRAPVQLCFDPGEHATVVPEGAAVSRAALRVTFRDQLDGAQRLVLSGLRLHTVTVAAALPEPIGAPADPASGSY
jgi:hypothetical protein